MFTCHVLLSYEGPPSMFHHPCSVFQFRYNRISFMGEHVVQARQGLWVVALFVPDVKAIQNLNRGK